jgi:hypothetical protein
VLAVALVRQEQRCIARTRGVKAFVAHTHPSSSPSDGSGSKIGADGSRGEGSGFSKSVGGVDRNSSSGGGSVTDSISSTSSSSSSSSSSGSDHSSSSSSDSKSNGAAQQRAPLFPFMISNINTLTTAELLGSFPPLSGAEARALVRLHQMVYCRCQG